MAGDECSFHVIAALATGRVVECDVVAVDAPTAAMVVSDHVRADDSSAVITQVHARRIRDD